VGRDEENEEDHKNAVGRWMPEGPILLRTVFAYGCANEPRRRHSIAPSLDITLLCYEAQPSDSSVVYLRAKLDNIRRCPHLSYYAASLLG
jgi:hypothetical protein